MQVVGLPDHVIRTSRAESRLLDAKTPDIEAVKTRRGGVMAARHFKQQWVIHRRPTAHS